jgi:transcription initiation factor IIE alpha subunit
MKCPNCGHSLASAAEEEELEAIQARIEALEAQVATLEAALQRGAAQRAPKASRKLLS